MAFWRTRRALAALAAVLAASVAGGAAPEQLHLAFAGRSAAGYPTGELIVASGCFVMAALSDMAMKKTKNCERVRAKRKETRTPEECEGHGLAGSEVSGARNRCVCFLWLSLFLCARCSNGRRSSPSS